jgi:endonuclease YncB( thermonuclease family)
MKFGFRIPSLRKRISAKISPARFVRHSMGIKAPRGWGWLTNPKKALYNRIYNRTTFGIEDLAGGSRRRNRSALTLLFMIIGIGFGISHSCSGYSGTINDSWQDHSYVVIKITDGDTFVATDGNLRFRVRMAGLDAPEKAQPYGKVASTALSGMINGKNVTIQPVGSGIDPYGRVLGKVYMDGSEVALNLISQGLSTYYRPRCVEYPENKKEYDYDPRGYVEAEKMARTKKLNMWSSEVVVLPCEFRKNKKTP